MIGAVTQSNVLFATGGTGSKDRGRGEEDSFYCVEYITSPTLTQHPRLRSQTPKFDAGIIDARVYKPPLDSSITGMK